MSFYNVTIKMEVSKKPECESLEDIHTCMRQIFSGTKEYHTVSISESLYNDESTRKALESDYDLSIRDGVSGGCYGARTGTSTKGLTLFVHLKEWDERWLDSDSSEIVNPYHLLNEHGKLIMEDCEELMGNEVFQSLGLKVSSDNTCNYEGQSSEDPYFLTGFQFDLIRNEDSDTDKVFLAVMLHCGGDVRGNYGTKMLFEFDYMEDVYSVIYPTAYLKGDDDE